MVEMQETGNILHQATPQSLIILDEIGRGTSTFDGMSIAWAVAEFLHDLGGKGVKTLFATHYHELTELARNRTRVKNFNVAIREWRQEILFFHKLTPGSSSKSYGIQVARLAGLPREITERAREILAQLEGGPSTAGGPGVKAKSYSSSKQEVEPGVQLPLFGKAPDWVQGRILELDPDSMTPLSALQALHSLREEILKDTPQRRAVVRTSRGRSAVPPRRDRNQKDLQ
jgi:DNA mismatch repair protein MutS